MTLAEGLGLAALAAYVAAVVHIFRRGGALQRVQGCHIVCPRLEESVGCRISQDIRTGQWIRVEHCSAFPDPEKLSCDQECIRVMNLGVRLPEARAA